MVGSPEQDGNVPRADGFKVDTSEVIAVGTPDHSEGLNTVLSFCYPEVMMSF